MKHTIKDFQHCLEIVPKEKYEKWLAIANNTNRTDEEGAELLMAAIGISAMEKDIALSEFTFTEESAIEMIDSFILGICLFENIRKGDMKKTSGRIRLHDCTARFKMTANGNSKVLNAFNR